MSLQSLSFDATLCIANKLSIEDRFICKHANSWLQHVMEYAGTDVGYMSIFKMAYVMASEGQPPLVIQKWIDKILQHIDPNGSIGFYDLQLVMLLSQSIRGTLSSDCIQHWQLNEGLEQGMPSFLAVWFDNTNMVQTMNNESLCRISINQGKVSYLKYFHGFSSEDITNAFIQVLNHRSIPLVHSFIKLYGTHLDSMSRDDMRLCWDAALWLDLDTFKIIDQLANYPTLSEERRLGNKLQQMSPAVFQHLKPRLKFGTLSPMASYFPKSDGLPVYQWLYTKMAPKTCIDNYVVRRLVLDLLEQGNIEALKWVTDKYNLGAIIASVCEIAPSLENMLRSKMNRHQIQECFNTMYGRTVEQICSDNNPFMYDERIQKATGIGSIAHSPKPGMYIGLLRYLTIPSNTWLLKCLHTTKQITPTAFTTNNGRCELTTYAILHKSPDVFEWLVSEGYPYDWTAMGAAVFTLDLRNIKKIHYRYFSHSTTKENASIMILASTRGNVDILRFLHQCGYKADFSCMLLETVQCCSITTAHYVFSIGNFSANLYLSYYLFEGALESASKKEDRFAKHFAAWVQRQVLPIFENTAYHPMLSTAISRLKNGGYDPKAFYPGKSDRYRYFRACLTVFGTKCFTPDKYPGILYRQILVENDWIAEIIGEDAAQAVMQWSRSNK